MPTSTISRNYYEFESGAVYANTRGPFLFEFDGALYWFGCASGFDYPVGGPKPAESDDKIHVMTSTDSGATWDELDSANAVLFSPAASAEGVPAPYPNNFTAGFTLCLDRDASQATVMTVITQRSPAETNPTILTDTVAFAVFNLAAGTWGGVSTTANPGVYAGAPGDGAIVASGDNVHYQLVCRGSGDYVFLFNGTQDSGRDRVYSATFDGSSFGTPGLVPGQTTLQHGELFCATTDATGRTYVFFGNAPSGPTAFNGQIGVTLSADDVWDTPQVMKVVGDYGPAGSSQFVSDPFIADGKVYILQFISWGDDTHVSFQLWFAPIGADPAWEHSDAVVGTWESPIFNWSLMWAEWTGPYVSVSFKDGQLAVAWLGNYEDVETGNNSGKLWYVTADASALEWSAPTALIETPLTHSKPTGGMAVLSPGGFRAAGVHTCPMEGGVGCVLNSVDVTILDEISQFAVIPFGEPPPTPPGSVTVTCSITILALSLLSVPIHNVWESGYIRQANESPKLARLGNADLWLRGNGPLIQTWKGLDGTPSVTPLLTNGGTVITDMSDAPGVVYQAKNDLKSENFTMRFETNALDAWMEISSFKAFHRPDKYVR